MVETVLLLLFLFAHLDQYNTVQPNFKLRMQKFQEILTEAAQLKQTQLKNQRKNYQSLPEYLKAGLNYSKKYQIVRKQHYMIQMNLSEQLKKKGNALFKKEQFKEALSCYEEALAVFRYINTKSYDNMKDDDLEYHIFTLPENLARFKEEYETHLIALYLNICSCLTKANKKEDAIHSTDQALKIKETAKGYYKKAQAYLQFINRQSSDIKLGFYFLNKCYEMSKDPSIIAQMQKIKREIDDERDKEKKWFKFMFDKNSQNKLPQEEKEKKLVTQTNKQAQSKTQSKMSEEVRQELERGQKGEKETEKLEKTKEKLSKFVNPQLSDMEWLEAYEGDFIAKHGSKIYSLIQLFGLKEYLGEYRALLAQCLQIQKQVENSPKRKQIHSKYFQWLKSHPVDQVTKYLERYELQTKWIRQQRSKKAQAIKEAKKQEQQPQDRLKEQKINETSIERKEDLANIAQAKSKMQEPSNQQMLGKDAENSNDNLKFIEEVHRILQKQPQKDIRQTQIPLQTKLQFDKTVQQNSKHKTNLKISDSQNQAKYVKYISFLVAFVAILLIKFVL